MCVVVSLCVSFYCSNDGADYAAERGGIMCPDPMPAACPEGPCFGDGVSLVDEGDVVLGALRNYQDCTWTLTCSDAALSPMLTFSAFDTEVDYDYLYLGDGTAADPSATYHGDSLPAPFVSRSGPVAVANYVSDDATNGNGFTATFSCVDSSTVPLAPVCCDVDGACDDGSDDWCCGETYDCCCLSVALSQPLFCSVSLSL